MPRLDWTPSRVALADPPRPVDVPEVRTPDFEIHDLDVLVRAFHGAAGAPPPTATTVRDAKLTIARHFADDLQDRQIYVFVDDQPWGKVRYGQTITEEVRPGLHHVRAFNTLFSRSLEVEVRPGEHVRLNCGNGFPKAGWLLMLVLHVTYLLVRLEREPAS